jgi:hypothetical protein
MNIKYLKTLTQGYEYRLQFTPDSCDWDAAYIQEMINANEVAKQTLGDPSFTVTRVYIGIK